MSRDGCIENFAEEGMVGESHVMFQLGMFLGLFGRTSRRRIEDGDARGRKGFGRFGGTRTNFGFKFTWGLPVMTSEETADVRGAGQLDIIPSLENIDTIEGGHQTKLFKRSGGFSRK
jgi:hypothetical protein